jgi:enoyl-CoA hydratase
MTGDSLMSERRGDVLLLTLDRPSAHNALDRDLLDALRAAVRSAAASGVRAIVLTGAGEKAFSAGADLRELDGMTADEARVTIDHGQEVFRELGSCGIPVVAAVNGLALGGGFELVLACAFPILSTRARLGLPESSLGLIPGYGGTQRLPRVLGPQVATHLMLTGSRLDADRAYALGLTPLPPVEPELLIETAIQVAERIAAQGPRAVRAILTAVHASQDAALPVGLALEAGLAALAIAGEESTEGIAAFLEKRPARYVDATREDR